jgi:hypothetical protein
VRLALALALALAAGCDPVQDSAIAALGGEAPGVRKGPLHRPGQPCTLCHDGAIGDPGEFTVAGTIYLTPSSKQGVDGALVTMIDSSLARYVAHTNAAGNFYVTPSQWKPVFPIQSVVVSANGVTATMYGEIGRSSACATCHVDPASATSPGHVSIQRDDGGTPL